MSNEKQEEKIDIFQVCIDFENFLRPNEAETPGVAGMQVGISKSRIINLVSREDRPRIVKDMDILGTFNFLLGMAIMKKYSPQTPDEVMKLIERINISQGISPNKEEETGGYFG